ncbi:MAG: restriction endonuclease subunit S [Sulfurimonadaceae bacterium]|jgi:type I restriction enzyme S subunit|nr:restriction endonuclease subunit S [Sulfurimonadaceae bacterium]
MKSEFSNSLTEYTIEEAISHLIDYRGKTPKKTSFGIPLVTAKIVKNGRLEPYNEFIAEKDYDSWMVRGIPKKGDVVLTVEAPLGEVAQLDETKIALAQRIVTLRGKENILDNTYFLYILKSSSMQSQLQSRASGTTVIGIKQSELRKIVLQLPPLQIQKKIAHILSTLDDKIELGRKMNQTLESMAQTLFKSWFVDFDPVHAKMRCKSEEELEAAAKELGISKEILELFPSEFEESELGMIPKGWEVNTLENIISINPSYQLKKQSIAKYIELKKLSTSLLSIEEVEYREYKGSGTKFKNGDTLLVRITPSLENGKRAYVDLLENEEVAWGSTEYIVLSAKNKFFAEWVYLLSISDSFRQYAIGSMNGSSGRQRVPNDAVRNYKLPIASNNLIKIFSEIISIIFQKIKINTNEIQTLQKTRDTLLPKLLSGEIDVSELEI